METRELINEVWRYIKGYKHLYEVSNYGRVRNIRTGRILKADIVKGYNRVTLYKKKASKRFTVHFTVHRLVAIAFIPNPHKLPCVNHKDENPLNNFVYVNEDGSVDFDKSNLEWCGWGYNARYGTRNKRIGAKLKNREDQSRGINQYTINGEFIKHYPSLGEAFRQTHIYNIQNCCCGRYKTAGIKGGPKYIWRYSD